MKRNSSIIRPRRLQLPDGHPCNAKGSMQVIRFKNSVGDVWGVERFRSQGSWFLGSCKVGTDEVRLFMGHKSLPLVLNTAPPLTNIGCIPNMSGFLWGVLIIRGGGCLIFQVWEKLHQ